MSRRLSLLLWVLACILSVQAETGSRMFRAYNASTGLADNSAQAIRCTKSGRLVISTMGQINFFDGHQFVFIDPEKENAYPLPNYYGNYHLYFDKYDHLWLKNTHTVSCVSLTTEMFVNSVEEVFHEFGIKEKVTDFFADSDGVVYLLTAKGLYSVDLKKYYNVRRKGNLQDIETYRDKYLLQFYDNGEVDVAELSTGTIVYSSHAYGNAEAKQYARSSVLYKDDYMYYQIRNGSKGSILQSFNIAKWEWKKLMETPYHLNNLDKKDSILYVPCEYGYWTYDLETGVSKQIDELQMINGRKLKTDVNAICFDTQGGMWIGTETWGLLYGRPYNPPFKIYSWDQPEAVKYGAMLNSLPSVSKYKGRRVNCLFKDSRGWRWAGTSSGLHLYKSESDNLPKVITRRDGLLNNVIHSIAEDQDHHIWVGTSYGLSCLKPKDDGGLYDIITYSSFDNVPDESFINGKSLTLPDGTIVMQTLDHIIAFNPNAMVTLQSDLGFHIYPQLVGLLINGNRVRTGDVQDGRVILKKALAQTKEIDVNYDQNSLSLTFSGLNYFRPQQTYYRVRVKELNDSWRILTPYNSQGLVDGKGQFHLPLVALSPGSYTIELQSSMSVDDWDMEPSEWIVNVNQPWWRETGLFIILGLVLLALFLINIYLYVRNVNMRARRFSGEQVIIRRIKLFADHCLHSTDEVIAPLPEEVTYGSGDASGSLSETFVETMLKLLTTVDSKRASQLSMKMLSAKAGMLLEDFYSLVNANIYKNPRDLVKRVMLQRAEAMLRSSGEDIADIAKKCQFSSPNYFIASFYREYHKLPEEYRRSR